MRPPACSCPPRAASKPKTLPPLAKAPDRAPRVTGSMMDKSPPEDTLVDATETDDDSDSEGEVELGSPPFLRDAAVSRAPLADPPPAEMTTDWFLQ